MNNIKKLIIAGTVLAAALSGGCGTSEDVYSDPDVSHISSDQRADYAYQTLDEETQLVYDQIVDAFENRREDVLLSTTSIEQLETACTAIRYDHCEYFWIDEIGYETVTKAGDITQIVLQPVYSMTTEEQREIQNEIDLFVDEILTDAPKDGTDFEKAEFVYETLISTLDYDVDKSVENSQNIISAFLTGETICQGYAYAAQYLFEQLDIPCTTVEGAAGGEEHAWNLVLLDGDYYYIDTVWGDSQYLEGEEMQYIDYDMLGASDETLFLTHTASDAIDLPSCTATADNYYVHEGRYITGWDETAIEELIVQAYTAGEDQAQIKFASTDLYEQALQYFIEDDHIGEILPEAEDVRVIDHIDENVLFLLF